MRNSIRLTAGIVSAALGLAALTPPAAAAASAEDREYVPFTASNGLSSEYHVYAAGVPRPAGLLVWTHGDGAYEFTHPRAPYVMGGPHGVKALANAQGYIVVSALSPDTDGTVTWWEDGEDNADYMADLIEHLTDEYDIDSSDIVMAGFSGGAQFTTQYFLPEHSGMIDGGSAIVFGGGGAPETSQQQPWDEGLKDTFFLHWATGELDTAENSDEGYDALEYAREGEAYYAAEGFETSHDWIPGEGHELDELFGDLLAAKLWEHIPRGGSGPVPEGTPAPPATDGGDWSFVVEPHAEFAYITVNVPAGIDEGYTRVRAEGENGYWYAERTGPGEHTVQMGDPCTPYWDPLLPGSEYAFRVYTVIEEDDGGERLVERAAGAFTTTTSAEEGVVAPVPVAPPTISGTPRIGSTLTSSPGEWDASTGAAGEVGYAYQWLRDGVPVDGAAAASYRVRPADRGATLSIEVTAMKTGAAGSASASARSAGIVVPVASVVLGAPDRLIGTRNTSFVVAVQVRAPGAAVTPTGEVRVTIAGEEHTGTLVDGRVTIDVGTQPRGVHTIRLSYAGDGTVGASAGWGGFLLVL